jgi:hypothetical protein
MKGQKTKVDRRLYCLTDGAEIFAVRALTLDELDQKRDEAKRATDGAVGWASMDNYVDAIVHESASIPKGL